jgi:uncharacterized damage-inducible protein DinB
VRPNIRLVTIVLACALAAPIGAQKRQGLMGDLMEDVAEVEKKVLDLARAMPEPAFAWRPAPGVRSTGEVLVHIAADNYFLPAAMGTAAPADTAITGSDYKTVAAYEGRTRTRDQIMAELEKSFAFLRQTMTNTPDARLEAPLDVFGRKMTHRSLWISTTTHLHEHLGQLIAYARANKVTPPWSK